MRYIVTVNGDRVTVDLDGSTLRVDGEAFSARLSDVEGTPVRLIAVNDTVHRLVVRRRGSRGEYTIWVDGFTFDVQALDERTRTIRDLSAASEQQAGPAPLVAPMPGLIVRVGVTPGDTVHAGQGIVVMEAMKMENELRAPGDGRVKAVHARAGLAVEKGAVLVELEA
ncbi:MAG TPA: biotin/lipoyl-containing protein [Gemmatimonadaceae bacterium]|nr:biotin/lipoyl-containing protein [Gemmatimonadaceae bacterium]